MEAASSSSSPHIARLGSWLQVAGEKKRKKRAAVGRFFSVNTHSYQCVDIDMSGPLLASIFSFTSFILFYLFFRLHIHPAFSHTLTHTHTLSLSLSLFLLTLDTLFVGAPKMNCYPNIQHYWNVSSDVPPPPRLPQ
jgi:hypothetical protein